MICYGIDESKGSSTVTGISSDGHIAFKTQSIEHTQEQVSALVKTIQFLSASNEIRVVCESTGYYHWQIVTPLLEAGIYVSIQNPIVTSKFAKTALRNVKTDSVDSVMLAKYGLLYWNTLCCSLKYDEVYDELHTYSRQYYQYLTLRVKSRLNLVSILDHTMPGITNHLKEENGNHKLTDFVNKFWHFNNITKHRESTFITTYQSWCKKMGYQFSTNKATTLYHLAKNGITTMPCTSSTKMIVQEAVRSLRFQGDSADLILTRMLELANSLPEFKILSSRTGIGSKLAVRFIAEVDDIKRFRNKHSLVAYAGLDAPPFQSGIYEGRNRHISKRGNKYLRKTCYEMIKCLTSSAAYIEHDDILDFVNKKRSEGFAYKKACVAGANKLLRTYYGEITALYK